MARLPPVNTFIVIHQVEDRNAGRIKHLLVPTLWQRRNEAADAVVRVADSLSPSSEREQSESGSARTSRSSWSSMSLLALQKQYGGEKLSWSLEIDPVGEKCQTDRRSNVLILALAFLASLAAVARWFSFTVDRKGLE